MLRLLLSSLILVNVLAVAAGQRPQQKEVESTPEQQGAEHRKMLNEVFIETKTLQGDLPILRFLEALEKLLPKEKGLSFRIDGEAFGKDYDEWAKTPIRFPAVPKRMSFSSALRLALSRLIPETEFVMSPKHITITTPQQAAYSATYDVRDIVLLAKYVLPDVRRMLNGPESKLVAEDSPEWLLQLITVEAGIRNKKQESIKIVNGVKLNVHTSPSSHEVIADMLAMLRRFADLAIVMNARLVEVDRAFYADQIVPMLAKSKEHGGSPALGPITVPVWAQLEKQKVILKGDDLKIRPQEKSLFLAQQEVFRFAATPNPEFPGQPSRGIGFSGVVFHVQGLVSADRRGLRLTITQKVAELVDIRKTKVLDRDTGKEVVVESPNIRKNSMTATLEIEDGQPLIMPVDYRAPGQKADRVLIFVAEPRIYIEEEEEQIRKGNILPIPKFGERKEPDPPKPLPLSKDVDQILKAIVADVLTNPDWKRTREFYGTLGDKKFVLVDGSVGWPKAFQPAIPGLEACREPISRFYPNRLLGICLQEYEVQGKGPNAGKVMVDLVVNNAGGSENGAVLGGCSATYTARKKGDQWIVELTRTIDP